jgi:hypothetical protein
MSRKESLRKFHISCNLAARCLEDISVFFLGGEGYAKLQKLDKSVGEFLEENVHIFCISIHVLLEFFILDQSHITRKHHQGLGGVVCELLGTTPLYFQLA